MFAVLVIFLLRGACAPPGVLPQKEAALLELG